MLTVPSRLKSSSATPVNDLAVVALRLTVDPAAASRFTFVLAAPTVKLP